MLLFPKLGENGASYKTGRIFEEHDLQDNAKCIFSTKKKVDKLYYLVFLFSFCFLITFINLAMKLQYILC